MADRWKLGNYTFSINPNKYGEQVNVIGDIVTTLDGTVISQPTSTKEDYTLSSVFYQNRPRIINQVSIPNLSGVKYVNGKYYILNNSTKKIDVYNSSFTLTKSITVIATPKGENLVAFDVQSDETCWVIEDSYPSCVYKVVGASVVKNELNVSYGVVRGVKYDNGNLWLVTSSCVLHHVNQFFDSLKSLSLPYITQNNLAYKGIETVNEYLVLSYVNDDIAGVYHIDKTNGFICNSFTLPDYTQIVDVTHDGTNYIFGTFTTNQLIYTNGHTLMLDIYNLEREMKFKGFLDMIDDMGVKRRVAVSSYNIERLEGSLARYNIDIQATKVNRGVN